MKVKVLRQFLNGNELALEGQVLDLDERRAKALERNNLVAPAEIGQKSRAAAARQAPAAEEAAAGGVPGPITTDRAGGLTGADRPASLSPPVRRRGRPRSRPFEA